MGFRNSADEPASEDAPEFVDAVPRLLDDLTALITLTASEFPPVRRIRSRNVITVYYGFGDALVIGFCSTFQKFTKEGNIFTPGDNIHYRYRHWCSENSEASSNYWGLLNLVEALELRVRAGELYRVEVFLFTDESTAESVFYNGNSTSKTLFNLVLRL